MMRMSSEHGRDSDLNSDVLSNCIPSILDTDLYKLTMQQAVLRHFPNAKVSYQFTNRSTSMKFNLECVELIQSRISNLRNLSLTLAERQWLEINCPYLQPDYLDFLQQFRFDPDNQVQCSFQGPHDKESETETETEKEKEGLGQGQLNLEIKGDWKQVILYEVPLMAIVSQSYFELVDTDWSQKGTRELAFEKASRLATSGVLFSEFGTRRRRSFEIQRTVLEGLIAGVSSASTSTSTSSSTSSPPVGKLLGTSNVHLARSFSLTPIGTIAHEWTMAIAALTSYSESNSTALKLWDEIYSPPNFHPKNPGEDLSIALTDTFSTKVFWRELDENQDFKNRFSKWRGVRQDSGDSKSFARIAKAKYQQLGIDPLKKVVIFSDGLDVEKCLELQRYSKEIGIACGFGIGTNLTNDFQRASDPRSPSKPLNIVIKLSSINHLPVVKISDDLTKNTGDQEEVEMVKRRFGIEKDSVEDA